MSYDVIIVGGGPAGLSAGLVLGRSRRRVLIIDAGNPRNARSDEMHGFLTRDGTHPAEFLAMAREEVKRYGVEVCEGTVMGARQVNGAFTVTTLGGEELRARKLMLATGVVDRVPALEGIDQFYGKSVHHCPYCDGWEYSDARIAVYGRGKSGSALALAMKNWSANIILCTHGGARMTADRLERLARHDVQLYEKRIRRLEGTGTKLERIMFEDGSCVECRALFFSTGNAQRSGLPGEIGCEVSPKGAIRTTRGQRSSVRGVWVCGDAAEDTQYVIVAAAEGAKAAMGINKELIAEDQDDNDPD